jgi:hypothetical protein
LANVFEKDGWIRIKSGELNFFGKSSISRENAFKVAFSDGHYVKDATGMRWVDGKVILLQGDKIAWIKQISRPHNAKVASNGNVVFSDSISKPSEHRLGSSLLVYDYNGDILLQRQFESNLNDCNITDDGRICFANTLYPDNTLYAIDIAGKQVLWSLKDKNASTGKIKLDQQNQIITIEKTGFGVTRTLDFSGKTLNSESEQALRQLQSPVSNQTILELLMSENKAIILEALEKLKSIPSNRKTAFETSPIASRLRVIFESEQGKLSDLAFENLLMICKREPVKENDTIDYLVRSVGSQPLSEKNLYRLSRLAETHAEAIHDLMPSVIACLKSAQEWNEKRWAAFVVGQVGKKVPDLVKDAIPMLTDYISHPEKTKEHVPEQRKDLMVGSRRVSITIRQEMGGVDPGTWLKDACIDALGDIGSADPALVSGSLGILETIASSASSEYSRSKAKRALEKVLRK